MGDVSRSWPPNRKMLMAAWPEGPRGPEDTQPLLGMLLKAKKEGTEYPDFSPPAFQSFSSASHWSDLSGSSRQRNLGNVVFCTYRTGLAQVKP